MPVQSLTETVELLNTQRKVLQANFMITSGISVNDSKDWLTLAVLCPYKYFTWFYEMQTDRMKKRSLQKGKKNQKKTEA